MKKRRSDIGTGASPLWGVMLYVLAIAAAVIAALIL